MGVMGCPNLPVNPKEPEGEKGVIFVAVKGQGAFQVSQVGTRINVHMYCTDEVGFRMFTCAQRSLTSPTLTHIHMSSLPSLSSASFCESVEAAHSDHSTNARIAKLLGITKESVRMDSQAKYCSIGRGDGDIYLRLPVSATYEEKVWVSSKSDL